MSVPSQHTSPVPPARANSAAEPTAESAPNSAAGTASAKEQGESFDELLTWAYTAAGERLHRVGARLRALPACGASLCLPWSVSSSCAARGVSTWIICRSLASGMPAGMSRLRYKATRASYRWMQRVRFNRISGLFIRFFRSFPALLVVRRASGTTRWRRRLLYLPVSRRRG